MFFAKERILLAREKILRGSVGIRLCREKDRLRCRTPNNSRPIIANQEPGVSGVKKAASPIRIKITPTTFLSFGLLWMYSLIVLNKFVNI